MRVHIATDHAGLELSAHLIEHLGAAGYEMVDHGPQSYDAQDDYPAFCINAAAAVVVDQQSGVEALGIVDTARLAREHNDANVIAVGGRQHSLTEATEIIEAFLATPFSGEERHVRRIGKIAHFEQTREVLA